jgi:hypothetical protein
MVHRLRSSISAGEGSGAWQAGVSNEPCRRRDAAETPADGERRSGADRRAERQRGIVERAALVFRGKTSLVPVTNSSKGGVTIETALPLEVGDSVSIAIPGQAPSTATVRWVRDGRVGLDLGVISL